MLEARPLGLDGVLEIRPKKHGDASGFFSETWNRRAMAEIGLDSRRNGEAKQAEVLDWQLRDDTEQDERKRGRQEQPERT